MSKESLLPATQLSSELRVQLREKYEKVLEKLNAIQVITTSSFKTNGKFQFTETEEVKSPIDITQVSDLRLLIRISGFLNSKKKEYDDAAKQLGLSSFPIFVHRSYTYEDWQSDIKVRIAVLTSTHERERLEKVKSELSSYFSTEDRLMDLLESI